MSKRVGHFHRRGIVSSPKLPSEEAVSKWLASRYDGAPSEGLRPAVYGNAAVELTGRSFEELQQLGEICHLDKDEVGNDKTINWNEDIWLDYINQVYATVPFEGGFIAIINANFLHTVVTTTPEFEESKVAMRSRRDYA